MLNKLIQWFNRNSCKECDYYCPVNNVCQSKKCATCGCHPYVNWFDRHFCEAYKAESEDMVPNKEEEDDCTDIYCENCRNNYNCIEYLEEQERMNEEDDEL